MDDLAPTPVAHAQPVRLERTDAAPVVTLHDCMPVLLRAAKQAYAHPHWLCVDAIITAIIGPDPATMTRAQLLTLYRCSGLVHLAIHRMKPPPQSSQESLELAVEYTRQFIKKTRP